MVGTHAGDMIGEIALAIEMGADAVDIRTGWDEVDEKWWFSVLDVIAVLTDQPDYKKVRNYWKWLKNKLIAEGSQLVSATNQLKLPASDGKKYLTDVVDTEQILRLIQSIPSKRAEPFKRWLAEAGRQRLDQLQDPELSIEQAMIDYKRLGYSDKWDQPAAQEHRDSQGADR